MCDQQTKELKKLKDLMEEFLIRTDQWLQDGIIDKDTYQKIRKDKVAFTEKHQ